jgi:hypothetical protein
MHNDRIYYSYDAEIHAVRKMTRLMVLCLIVGLGIGAALREAIEPMVKRAEKEFGELQKNVEEHLKQS